MGGYVCFGLGGVVLLVGVSVCICVGGGVLLLLCWWVV